MSEPKVLILGGYGAFGGRLAQLVRAEQGVALIIAGRALPKAQAFCARLRCAALPAAFDRDGDVEQQLRALAPTLVVDASGPFQSYGDDRYRLVRAALALGIHYLDLADASDFVKGIVQFDAAARARGIFVLAGVSTFPVLTAAAVSHLATGMAQVEGVTGGIAPSPYANVGMNVIRAIASYAGRPVTLIRGGRTTNASAFIDSVCYTIAPPGLVPLAPIRFSLVDVPDLQVLPDLWPSLRSVWMGAGPVPAIWHRLLSLLAWLVHLKILRSLSPLASLMYRVINLLRWGEHRGGMFIEVEGTAANGGQIVRSWHLLAEGDDGPLIPSMAAAAIIRRCLAGRPPTAGARVGAGELELDDYAPLFAGRQISTGCRQSSPSDVRAPLYRRLLGEAWGSLPQPLRAVHDLDRTLVAEGIADVERGNGVLARMVAWTIGFPPSGRNIPVKVAFEASGGREHWQRSFGKCTFTSTQEQGRGRFEQLLCERFGPLRLGMALLVEDGRMRLVLRRWSMFGVPLPLKLAPRSNSFEFVQDGRFRFHVEIAHPLTGAIVAYRGWLVPRP
jgi:Domain of unknown function (DUF4166)/Saccharopine dehydrogenase NADP binding domain